MNISDDEELIEVGRYMTALNENFIPENNASRKEYTFQLLEATINNFNLSKYWESFFKTMLFDTIIGNTDRHQENWAFLGKTTSLGQPIKALESDLKDIKEKGTDLDKLPWFLKYILGMFIDIKKGEISTVGKQAKLMFTRINSFAPIYDSGSSLVRELTDERVEQLLQDEVALEKYINNGSAELHWDKIKLTHFQLIENLVNSSYIETIRNAAAFLSKWDDAMISVIMNDLDKDLPEAWNVYRIPESRKQLIIKIVSLRTKKLKDLLGGGI
jgi:hypothetical protein